MKRIDLYLVFIAIALFGFLLDRYYKLRDNYYAEYLKHKEVMLFLSNYQTRQKALINENLIREKLSQVGADFMSFEQSPDGFEIKAKNLKGENLPTLVYSFESAGLEIIKLKAVDNTGEGIYDLQLLLR